MAAVHSILDQVWNELRQASIVGDLLIIEYIAALLIEMIEEAIHWSFAVVALLTFTNLDQLPSFQICHARIFVDLDENTIGRTSQGDTITATIDPSPSCMMD